MNLFPLLFKVKKKNRSKRKKRKERKIRTKKRSLTRLRYRFVVNTIDRDNSEFGNDTILFLVLAKYFDRGTTHNTFEEERIVSKDLRGM